jgi:uncharacterized membrane protein
MTRPKPAWTDEQVEQVVGNLLRFGVLTAAVVVLLGAAIYLRDHGRERADDHSVFKGEPSDLRSPVRIVADALAFRDRALIQFGLLLLIATPVARVFFSAFAFARQRDWTYVLITLIVLTVLLYSLFSGYELG